MPSGPGSASSASASSAQPAAPAAKAMPLFPGATFKARGQARPRSRSKSGPKHRWASPSPPSSYREQLSWSWPTGTHVQCEATLIVLQRAWAQSMVDACVAIDVLAPMCWHVISGACVLGHAVARSSTDMRACANACARVPMRVLGPMSWHASNARTHSRCVADFS